VLATAAHEQYAAPPAASLLPICYEVTQQSSQPAEKSELPASSSASMLHVSIHYHRATHAWHAA
jgi:hypothetical protein